MDDQSTSRGRGWHLQLMIFSMFTIVSLSSRSQELSVTDGDRGGGREPGSRNIGPGPCHGFGHLRSGDGRGELGSILTANWSHHRRLCV